jgi:hypothetical protein
MGMVREQRLERGGCGVNPINEVGCLLPTVMTWMPHCRSERGAPLNTWHGREKKIKKFVVQFEGFFFFAHQQVPGLNPIRSRPQALDPHLRASGSASALGWLSSITQQDQRLARLLWHNV